MFWWHRWKIYVCRWYITAFLFIYQKAYLYQHKCEKMIQCFPLFHQIYQMLPNNKNYPLRIQKNHMILTPLLISKEQHNLIRPSFSVLNFGNCPIQHVTYLKLRRINCWYKLSNWQNDIFTQNFEWNQGINTKEYQKRSKIWVSA